MRQDEERPPLSEGRIVEQALEIVRENGLRGLSMRRLGARLGVDPMAVYYYVGNKAGLEQLIVERLMALIVVPSDPESPTTRICEAMRSMRKVLLSYGDAVELFPGRNLETPGQLEPVEAMLRVLLEAGLSEQEALWAVNALSDYVIGAVAGEVAGAKSRNRGRGTVTTAGALSEERFPALWQVLSRVPVSRYERQFEYGLTSLVHGIVFTHEEGGREDE
jgi:AcrR family transcriptional regulator